jgi:hypothetical protein
VVKYKDLFCVLRLKAREGTDTKSGLKLFTKVGRTVFAVLKNFAKVPNIPISELLGSHMPKYALIDGYYCMVFNPKPKYYKQFKPMEEYLREKVFKWTSKEGVELNIASELNLNNLTEEYPTFQSLTKMAVDTLSFGF